MNSEKEFGVSATLGEFMGGGGTTVIPPGLSPEDQFLHVIGHGINWQAPEYARSSFDFAKGLDMEALVQCVPDLHGRYVAYLVNATGMLEHDVSTIAIQDSNDSLIDVLDVFARIVRATIAAGQPLASDDQALGTSMAALKEAHDHGEFESDEDQLIATHVISQLEVHLLPHESGQEA